MIDNIIQIKINFNLKLINYDFFANKMKSDNNKQIFLKFDYNNIGLCKTDNKNQMITLTVIAISDDTVFRTFKQ